MPIFSQGTVFLLRLYDFNRRIEYLQLSNQQVRYFRNWILWAIFG